MDGVDQRICHGDLTIQDQNGVMSFLKKAKFLTAFLLAAFLHIGHAEVFVKGAGASLPAEVMRNWTEEFSKKSHTPVSYVSTGSGEGIRKISTKGVSFALSEIPLTDSELKKSGLVQFPLLAAAIVPVVNLPNLDNVELKLNGKILADIFLGKIKNWKSPEIASMNPTLQIPDLPIQVVYRSDISGTSFVFTSYLSQNDADWRDSLGMGTLLKWPVGTGVKETNGVVSKVKSTPGAIGYVEGFTASKNGLTVALVANNNGYFNKPDISSIQAGLSKAKWTKAGMYENFTQNADLGSWPIVSVSYVLMNKKQADPITIQEAFKFFDWTFNVGYDTAYQSGLIPIVTYSKLQDRVHQIWSTLRNESGQAIYSPKN
jgi:phosphate transport system substrate-binding protein